MKLSLHCRCGASLSGTISPDRSAEGLRALWIEYHSREGCAPVGSRQAQRIRRSQERKEAA